MPERPMRQQMEEFILSLQDDIVKAFESPDANAPAFKRDSWVRPSASPSTTVLEKAGVNTSIVHSILPPVTVKQMRTDHASVPLQESPEGLPFFAAGISLVIRPRNPHAPAVHANYRYFEITEPVPKHIPKRCQLLTKNPLVVVRRSVRSHTFVSLRRCDSFPLYAQECL